MFEEQLKAEIERVSAKLGTVEEEMEAVQRQADALEKQHSVMNKYFMGLVAALEAKTGRNREGAAIDEREYGF